MTKVETSFNKAYFYRRIFTPMEISFLTPLIVKPIPKNSPLYDPILISEDSYELVEDLVISVDGTQYAVPKGFRYDGASIPGVFWLLTYSPFSPDVMRAAAVHDWMYYSHPFGETHAARAKVDKVFYRILIMEKVSRLKAGIMYLAVRLMGWTVWPNSKANEAMLKAIQAKVLKSPRYPLYCFPDVL